MKHGWKCFFFTLLKGTLGRFPKKNNSIEIIETIEKINKIISHFKQ